MTPRLRDGGPIAWMASNSVAANLLMMVLLFGGIFMMTQIQQEYLPKREADTVSISVALPGATPAEVEQSVVLALEEALQDVQDIASLTATASEGSAYLSVELGTSRPRQELYDEIERAVDGVTSLPEDAEEPVVKPQLWRPEVLEIVLHGDADEMSLRMAAEHLRALLLQQPEISQVDISQQRALELHVEVPDQALRTYGLTLSEVARIIRETSLERSGGTLETSGGDLIVRLADRREAAADFARIPVVTDARGTVVRLGDIATITEGFETDDRISTFDGGAAIEVEVFRVGEETPFRVAEAARRVLPEAMATLPESIEAAVLNDRSENFSGRMDLLTKNGLIGLALVLLILSLFLEIRLAFWVALGIPTAFMGAMLVLPWAGMSINMISMFAFLVALGLVVDDAIVAGENIYEYRQRGMRRLEAAIQGARDISVPLSFSILTNIVAFIPLALVPGWMGQMWMAIPVVVSLAFLMSWIEALFILPAHLASVQDREPLRLMAPLNWLQDRVAGGLDWFTRRVYGRLLDVAIGWRYVTVSILIAVFLGTYAWVDSGRLGFGLWPPVPRDYSRAVVTMPVGTPLPTTLAARDRVIAAAEAVIAANGGERLSTALQTDINGTEIDVRAHLTPPEVRPMPTTEFTSAWRQALGEVASARSIRFESSWAGASSANLEVRLSHPDTDVLAAASARLAAELAEFEPVRDVDDGFTPGKAQLEFRLTEAGRSLGLTSEEVASQVRAAFHGVEALSQQQGRNEVTVRVRRPESGRRSAAEVERLPIRTPDGGLVPLFEVAEISRSRADAKITREDGMRVVTVSANVEPTDATSQVQAALAADVLPQLQLDYPGIGYSLEGHQATQRETMDSFTQVSVPLALVIIYALLAIPFRSYLQPAVIMASIPFGFVGAILGHMIMGYSLSIISIFGIIALSGVVINAGIVMIDYANKARDAGATPREAIWRAGQRRFRPILLTTMTTFGGLAPMIFETSRQAQFLIPMAISLGYGIVFATVIVLFLIPCLYVVLEDLRTAGRFAAWLVFAPRRPAREAGPPPPERPVAAE